MARSLLLAALFLIGGCREEDRLGAYLGPYYGGFDTALTADPYDDLNPNECLVSRDGAKCETSHGNPLSHLLMKLDRNREGDLTLHFYRTQEDYADDRAMYLSQACRSTLGPASDYRVYPLDESRDETQLLATASFPLIFGNTMLACTGSARFGSASAPHMAISLQVNPVTGASAVSVELERSRRDGDYLYVRQQGEKVPVKLDLRYAGSDHTEARRLCAADGETKLETGEGYRTVCIMTGRDEWQVVLPISPFGPGVTALWGSTRSPKWYRTRGEPDTVTYHHALFLPVQFETGP
jgi:hypothetical protein